MQIFPNALALAAILGMALVTYLTRIGDLWLMKFVTPSPCIMAWLRSIPGAVLVAPTIVSRNSLVTLPATLATILMMVRTKNVVLALIAGVGTLWLFRTFVHWLLQPAQTFVFLEGTGDTHCQVPGKMDIVSLSKGGDF